MAKSTHAAASSGKKSTGTNTKKGAAAAAVVAAAATKKGAAATKKSASGVGKHTARTQALANKKITERERNLRENPFDGMSPAVIKVLFLQAGVVSSTLQAKNRYRAVMQLLVDELVRRGAELASYSRRQKMRSAEIKYAYESLTNSRFYIDSDESSDVAHLKTSKADRTKALHAVRTAGGGKHRGRSTRANDDEGAAAATAATSQTGK